MPSLTTGTLIAQLDLAVEIASCQERCERVKDVLHDCVKDGGDFLPESFLQPVAGTYARRLLHKDPQDRYSIVVMVWDRGQGTSLHDHCGHWCVECVYQGEIEVVSYDLIEQRGDFYRFSQEKSVTASVSDAGALIPPFEYHTIANPLETPAVTIHVYSGELDWCYVFTPVEGGHQRVKKSLSYSA